MMPKPSPVLHKQWHSRGYLPHFDHPSLLQAITFRLADALPRAVLDRLDGESLSSDTRRQRVEAHLDAGYGECLLKKSAIAELVQEALLHFDGQRYRLLAWCVMPNHVHVVADISPGWPLDGIVHSWKSYTAKAINHMENRTGRLWQKEYFDRYIRDQVHLEAAMAYIYNNPVKAGLVARAEDWPYSSARNSASESV